MTIIIVIIIKTVTDERSTETLACIKWVRSQRYYYEDKRHRGATFLAGPAVHARFPRVRLLYRNRTRATPSVRWQHCPRVRSNATLSCARRRMKKKNRRVRPPGQDAAEWLSAGRRENPYGGLHVPSVRILCGLCARPYDVLSWAKLYGVSPTLPPPPAHRTRRYTVYGSWKKRSLPGPRAFFSTKTREHEISMWFISWCVTI